MKNKKFYFQLMAAAMTLAMGSMLTACGDDDDDNSAGGGSTTTVTVNPSAVFTAGLPKVYDEGTITTNAQGLVTAISKSGTTVTFEYADALTRATAPDVVVKIVYGKDEYMTMNLTLGANGFVSHCDETSYEHGEMETATWDFSYNADGQLVRMVRSEGGYETTTITYKDGDITEVKQVSQEDPEDGFTAKISYTDGNVKTPIDNKGCVMLFDEEFEIDMDEMAMPMLPACSERPRSTCPWATRPPMSTTAVPTAAPTAGC